MGDGQGEFGEDPKCRVCGVALHDHLGHEGLCRQVQELVEERDCARKSLSLACRVLRLTVPRMHGCLCDRCLEEMLLDDCKGIYRQLSRLAAQTDGRAASIRRLLEENADKDFEIKFLSNTLMAYVKQASEL